MSLIQVHPGAVVFDEWYMCKDMLEFCSNRSLTWVSQSKSNRLIQMGEDWIQLGKYAKSLHKKMFNRINKKIGEKRFKWFYETTIVMKNLFLYGMKTKDQEVITNYRSKKLNEVISKVSFLFVKKWIGV